MVTNADFLKALFGEEAGRAHVTGFGWDPNEIPSDKHLAAWAGGPAATEKLRPEHNNYFTISIFGKDDQGRQRRRKALFEQTHVVVLDDVREKLDEAQARKLPEPTYILETSPGSQQWGYKLVFPETQRHRVENLQDGLVASGMAPDGKDPGMKGVTRYVRLPVGCNTKKSKMMFGMPYTCRLVTWQPDKMASIEQLAEPFGIDLDADRREQRVDGAADVDHPITELDCIQVKETRGPGRFDIVCPWVHEHTGAADDGAAVFTNEDGSIGFKCHHGACESRTAKDLMAFVEQENPGFRRHYKKWQVTREFFVKQQPDFLGPTVPESELPPAPSAPPAPPPPSAEGSLQPLLDELSRAIPGSQEARHAAERTLRAAEDLGTLDKESIHARVRDSMDWSKQEFNKLIKSLRDEWYSGSKRTFSENILFVGELNAFYDWSKDAFYSVEAFTNHFLHQDENVRTTALKDGAVEKVDRLDYAPGMPRVFTEGNVRFGNMYCDDDHPKGKPGDASPWLDHWLHMGWGEKTRKHMLQFMAYTLRYPWRKINHFMILGSPQGSGKDFLLTPLTKAMGKDANVIDGDALTENYTDYVRGVKYLHINEAELGDRREAAQVVNKLKPLAAAPPDHLRVREMYTKPFYVRNIVNGTFCTNSRFPLRLQDSRRFFAAWSDLYVRNPDGNVKPEWNEYWKRMWAWMSSGGVDACIWHLYNEVDLSDFNPGEPPPVTDFMRDIQNVSKPPIQKTLELALDREALDRDLMSVEEVVGAISKLPLTHPGLLQTDLQKFTYSNVQMALQEMGMARLPRLHGAAVFALRHTDWYQQQDIRTLRSMYIENRPGEENKNVQLIRDKDVDTG